MVDNSVVSGGNQPKFELIQAFMHVLVTCKNEEVKSLERSQDFSHYIKVYGDIWRCSRAANRNSTAHGPIWPNFDLSRDFMVVPLYLQE